MTGIDHREPRPEGPSEPLITRLIRHKAAFSSRIQRLEHRSHMRVRPGKSVQHAQNHVRHAQLHTDGNYCFLHNSQRPLESRLHKTPSTSKEAP